MRKISLLLILSCIYIVYPSEKAVSAVNTANTPTTADVIALDTLIQKFEFGFMNFTESVAKLFKNYERNINPKTLAELKKPLRLFVLNFRNNPHRNVLRYYGLRKSRGEREPFFRFDDNSHFYYAVLPMKYRKYIAAGVMMQTRILYLNPDYNPNSIMDNLVVFHELVHGMQDMNERNRLKALGANGETFLKKYLHQLNHAIKNPDWEPIAYAKEIELLNILFKGKLRRLIQSGQPNDEENVATLLRADTQEKRGALQTLLKYTRYYFQQNCWIYSYTREYRSVILTDNIRTGSRFFQSDDRYIRPERSHENSRTAQPQDTTPTSPVQSLNRAENPSRPENSNQNTTPDNNRLQGNNAFQGNIDIN